MKSEDERIAINEIDLILAELQNYMVHVPATMKAKEAIESLLREARLDELQRIPKYGLHDNVGLYAYQIDKTEYDARIAQLTQEKDND